MLGRCPAGPGLQRGANFAARAVALGAPTPREQGFIAAAAALYRGADSIPNSQRLLAYSDTLARLYHDFPNDPEVAIYYALSLCTTASKTDTTFARQKRANEIFGSGADAAFVPRHRRLDRHQEGGVAEPHRDADQEGGRGGAQRRAVGVEGQQDEGAGDQRNTADRGGEPV